MVDVKKEEPINDLCNWIQQNEKSDTIDSNFDTEQEKNKIIKCNNCLDIFSTKRKLVYHINHTICGLKMKCNLCSKIFSTKHHLISHIMRQTPCNEILYCENCFMTFKRKYNREMHKCIYSGFKCQLCFKIFKSNDELEKHITTQQIPCDEILHCECGSIFDTLRDLRIHENNHFGFKCQLCSKIFSTKHHLISHQMRQTPCNQKLICEHCSKVFRLVNKFIAHSKGKVCIKRNKCPTCSKIFQSRTLLNKHMKSQKCGPV